MKVLVLGASGMLGNAMLSILAEKPSLTVIGSVRSPSSKRLFPDVLQKLIVSGADADNLDSVYSLMSDIKPDVVINCVGLIKQLKNSDDPLQILPVNSLFPHRLAKLCELSGARLVHISTDCVFSGTRGDYSENDSSDANDLYGKSKFLGEVHSSNSITLRTSIIGHELSSSNGLVEWFLSQNNQVQGYVNAIFSGLPTVELARIIRDVILIRPELSGLYHLASKPISKYDLLELIKGIYCKKIEIIPDATVVVNRSLNAARFAEATGYVVPDWPELVSLMKSYS